MNDIKITDPKHPDAPQWVHFERLLSNYPEKDSFEVRRESLEKLVQQAKIDWLLSHDSEGNRFIVSGDTEE